MYYNILKSLKYRNKFNLVSKQKWFINIVLKNNYLFFNKYDYNKLKNYTSITKIRNRCIINGKTRSVHSKIRLSRFFLKSYCSNGRINGCKKK